MGGGGIIATTQHRRQKKKNSFVSPPIGALAHSADPLWAGVAPRRRGRARSAGGEEPPDEAGEPLRRAGTASGAAPWHRGTGLSGLAVHLHCINPRDLQCALSLFRRAAFISLEDLSQPADSLQQSRDARSGIRLSSLTSKGQWTRFLRRLGQSEQSQATGKV